MHRNVYKWAHKDSRMRYLKSDQPREFGDSFVTVGLESNQCPTSEKERWISPGQRQTFSGESTVISLIMDLSNATVFSCEGIFNRAADGP